MRTPITAVSIAEGTLPAREHMIARIAALAAVGAAAASYLLNAGTAAEARVTLEDVARRAVAVAPIVGTLRIVSAAANIAKALGFAIAVAAARSRGRVTGGAGRGRLAAHEVSLHSDEVWSPA